MNRLLLTILIGLIWTSNSIAQVQNSVMKVLQTKNFITFKQFADNLPDREKKIRSYWEYLRDLTTEFKEGVFIFEKLVPYNDNSSNGRVYTFKTKIIATKTQIVYYELSEKKTKKVDNEWKPYFDPIDNFKDKELLDSLKNLFQGIFRTEFNENELFVTDFVYGEHCGIAGRNPKGRQQIEEWVANKNKMELLKWLKSTNTEKQVYGVDGLYQLKKMHIKLTDAELKMIKFIINKSGTMYVCSGCLYTRDEIGEVTSKFKF